MIKISYKIGHSVLTQTPKLESFFIQPPVKLTPKYVKSQIPKVSDEPLEQWLKRYSAPTYYVDVKYDGERVYLQTHDNTITMANRGVTTYNREGDLPIPSYLKDGIKKAVGNHNVLLDCEYAVKQDDFPSFLSQRHAKPGDDDLVIRVFDILELDGQNLRNLPLSERRRIMKQVIDSNDKVHEVKYWTATNESEIRKIFKEIPGEGVVVKPSNSPYLPGVGNWLKLKKSDSIDLSILGGKKSADYKKSGLIHSLLVGFYSPEDDTWTPYGYVGTGLNRQEKQMLTSLIHKYTVSEDKDTIYVSPFLTVEVEALEFNKNAMRSPRVKRLRHDKSPMDCLVNQLEGKIK